MEGKRGIVIYPYCLKCKSKADTCLTADTHRAERSIVWKIYVKPGGRKGRQIHETRLTKALAEAREREIKVQHQRGELFLNEKPRRTFGQACQHFVDNYLVPNKQYIELYAVRDFKKHIGESTQLENISRDKLLATYNLIKQKWSLATCIRRWNTLQGIFRENAAFISGNPARGIIPKRDRKNADRKKTVYFTNEQYKNLIKHLPTEEAKDIVIIFRHTGFRKGDGVGLMFEQCDFNMRTIHLVNQKNGEQSSVPMVPEVYERLRGIQIRSGRLVGPVFNFTNFRKMWQKALADSDLIKPKPDNLTLHSLRHSFGTYVQSAYKDLNVTKELLRHKNITMTMRYAHAADEAKRSAAIAATVESDKATYGVIYPLSPEKSTLEKP